MKKRSERRKHCALPVQARSVLHLCTVPNVERTAVFVQKLFGVINFEISSRDPGHAHLGGRFKFPTQAGSALFICVSSLKRIAQFVQKLSRGPEIRKLGHVTPATPGLWVVLWFHCREAPSSMSVPNLKRIAHFVQTLLGGPKITFERNELSA